MRLKKMKWLLVDILLRRQNILSNGCHLFFKWFGQKKPLGVTKKRRDVIKERHDVIKERHDVIKERRDVTKKRRGDTKKRRDVIK